ERILLRLGIIPTLATSSRALPELSRIRVRPEAQIAAFALDLRDASLPSATSLHRQSPTSLISRVLALRQVEQSRQAREQVRPRLLGWRWPLEQDAWPKEAA